MSHLGTMEVSDGTSAEERRRRNEEREERREKTLHIRKQVLAYTPQELIQLMDEAGLYTGSTLSTLQNRYERYLTREEFGQKAAKWNAGRDERQGPLTSQHGLSSAANSRPASTEPQEASAACECRSSRNLSMPTNIEEPLDENRMSVISNIRTPVATTSAAVHDNPQEVALAREEAKRSKKHPRRKRDPVLQSQMKRAHEDLHQLQEALLSDEDEEGKRVARACLDLFKDWFSTAREGKPAHRHSYELIDSIRELSLRSLPARLSREPVGDTTALPRRQVEEDDSSLSSETEQPVDGQWRVVRPRRTTRTKAPPKRERTTEDQRASTPNQVKSERRAGRNEDRRIRQRDHRRNEHREERDSPLPRRRHTEEYDSVVSDAGMPRHQWRGAMDAATALKKWDISYTDSHKENADSFLERLEGCRLGTGLGTTQLLAALPLVMRGEAKTWYKLNQVRFSSWRQFRQLFRRRFGSRATRHQILEEARNRLQGDSENLAAYVEKMRLIFSHLSPPLELEEELDMVYDNLRRAYRQVIRRRYLRSYEDLMAEGEDLEREWDRARIKRVPVPEEDAIIPEAAYKGHRTRPRGDNRMATIDHEERKSSSNGKSPRKKENKVSPAKKNGSKGAPLNKTEASKEKQPQTKTKSKNEQEVPRGTGHECPSCQAARNAPRWPYPQPWMTYAGAVKGYKGPFQGGVTSTKSTYSRQGPIHRQQQKPVNGQARTWQRKSPLRNQRSNEMPTPETHACYNCLQLGHWARQCPLPRRIPKKAEQPSQKNGNKISGN